MDSFREKLKDKKKIIGDLRKKLEKHYPIIYEKTSQVPNADEVRKILNINGLENCKILASNSLDEYIIADLMNQGACIYIFGVGERLITAKSEPVFGGVYKLVAVEENDNIVPRIKLS